MTSEPMENIPEVSESKFSSEKINELLVYYLILAAALAVVTATQSLTLSLVAKRQVRRIRHLYFQAITRQDIAWHDENESGSLITKLSDSTFNIEQGLGTKCGECVQQLSGFVIGIIIGFAIEWRLALVATSMLPLIVVTLSLFGIIHKKFFKKELDAYSKAGAIANEVLGSIRTVISFGGEKKEVGRYTSLLNKAERVGLMKSVTFGGAMGLMGFSMYVSAALIFWYGIKLMLEEGLQAGDVITVFANVIIGSIFLGSALMNFPSIVNAITVAKEVFGTIDRIPPIAQHKDGHRINAFTGRVVFRNVSFSYATRKDTPVLTNFSLDLESGQKVALVGPSGSGKSTVIHMIQRFYDATEGEILIDGVDIRELDVTYHRQHLGCVQQEPVLFEGTIMENIRMGKPDATDEEIMEAARLANAHDFILDLPEAYETRIGEVGAGMSGGQKQRIAIARAIVRKPQLLLLDEATSALDTKSEREVHEALEKAAFGRTVLVVAHRLTTVRNADMIMVLNNGLIQERGTHDQLIEMNGLYAAMVRNQKQSDTTEDDEEAIDDSHPDKEEASAVEAPVVPGGADDGLSDTISINSISSSAIDIQVKNAWQKLKSNTTMRLLKMNRPESFHIICGCLCALIAGLGQPAFALLYAEVYNIFSMKHDPDKMYQRITLISSVMAGCGCIRLLIGIAQGYFLGYSGERLIKRIRSRLFESMLQQEVSWFDEPDNQCGSLTAMLMTEASKVAQFTGSRLGGLSEAVMVILVSIVTAFYFSWQVSLVILAFFPFMVGGSIIQNRMFQGGTNQFTDSESFKIAQESIRAHRTVTSFSLEEFYAERFDQASRNSLKSQVKQALVAAIVYTLPTVIPLLSFCTTFALGTYLIEKKMIEMTDLFRAFLVISFGAQALGRTASVAPDANEAIKAVSRMLTLMDRIPRIISNAGDFPSSWFSGRVTFRNVYFRYPTRPTVRVIKNFSHTINPGRRVALVGQSGCGKSTIIQLLQRFYDPSDHGPDSGIYFDGHNLRDLAPSWVRQQIGIVSQEPTLFNMSLRDNIAYGDNSRDVPIEEIFEAARMANIHEFISSLPQGYDTMPGEGGSQLSGGQKQRIAIARALLRRPVLLLLDEATSSLDSENERIVQAALDDAMASHTSLVVAHRLNTVDQADEIVVIESGRKIECGRPSDLLAAKGAFYALHHATTDQQG